MWLAELSPGGGIAVQFRACRKGKARDHFEKGTWRFEGGIEYIRITWSGGQTVLRETPYRVLSADGGLRGFSAHGGLALKRRLLELESAAALRAQLPFG